MVKADMTASELITGSIMNPYLGALSAITWGQDVVYNMPNGWEQPEKQTKEAIRKKLIKAAENRLLEESVEAGIIDELVDKIYTGGSGVSVAEKVKISTIKGYSNFIKAFSKPYQSTDAIFKISQWESEMKSQDKIYGTDRTQEEKEAEATRRVRGEQPTYSEQASIFRALTKNIFLSTFISFDVQTWRNRYNIMSNAGKLRREAAETTELANQYKRRGDTANYEKYKKRAKRLTVAAGVKLGAFGLSAVALKLVAMAFASSAGMDGDDEDNISLASDPWYSKNITKIWTSGNKKNTKFYDFSYIDPWSNFWKPVTAAARGDGFLDGILAALEEVTSPYLAKEVLWGKVEESIAGIDEQGNELSNEEMSFPNRIGRPLFHALSALEPGVWRDSKAIVNDLLFTDPTDHKGSTKKAGVVFWNAVLGMKEKEVDVMKSNSYMRYNQHNKIDVVLSNYRNPKIGETAKHTQDRLDSYWNLMKKQYDALIALGFTHNDVVKSYAYTDKKGKYHSPTSGQNLRKVKMMNLLSQGKKWVLDEEKGDIKLPKKGKKSKYVNIQGAGNKTNISVE
jgi:hypothetical protein